MGSGADKSWDLAVIRLKDRIPTPYSYLGCDGRDVGSGGVVLAGYPTDGEIVEFQGVSVVVGSGRLKYSAATTVGMSGGPLFVPQGGHYWVLGVHTHDQNQPTQAVFLDKRRTEWIDSFDRSGSQ